MNMVPTKKAKKLLLKSNEGALSDASLAISKKRIGSPTNTKVLLRNVLEFY